MEMFLFFQPPDQVDLPQAQTKSKGMCWGVSFISSMHLSSFYPVVFQFEVLSNKEWNDKNVLQPKSISSMCSVFMWRVAHVARWTTEDELKWRGGDQLKDGDCHIQTPLARGPTNAPPPLAGTSAPSQKAGVPQGSTPGPLWFCTVVIC